MNKTLLGIIEDRLDSKEKITDSITELQDRVQNLCQVKGLEDVSEAGNKQQ